MHTKKISMTLAVLTVLSASPVLAVQGSGDVVATAAVPEPEKAKELQDRAEALFSQPKQWRKAVRLLERAADLRGADDAAAYDCLVYAGRIGAGIGDFQGARANMEKAAAHAMARGAIIDAANAYIDAAHAAVALKDARSAQELVDRATLLTESPMLSAAQRTVLKARLAA
ncbi:MAG: hypothetical protein KFH98_13430 [Gemmatimonadetes bacterium]|nr:hypothetical protein [Gemmatimonadota bacterium]